MHCEGWNARLTVNLYYLWEIHQCWHSNARSLCPPNEVGDLRGYTCMIAWFSDVEPHLLQLLIKYWSLQKQCNMIVVSSTCSATFPCLAKKEKKTFYTIFANWAYLVLVKGRKKLNHEVYCCNTILTNKIYCKRALI